MRKPVAVLFLVSSLLTSPTATQGLSNANNAHAYAPPSSRCFSTTDSNSTGSTCSVVAPSKGGNGKVERPRIPVLHYKDNYVCVNKPAGLTVHRSKGTPRRTFVLSTLLKRQLSRKVFPVHRLDHRTSGAILFAFDSKSAGKIHGSLRSDDATKQYVALLRGDLCDDLDVEPGQKISIDKPLKVDGVEKTARTDFTLLASIAGSDDQRNDIESRADFVPSCSLVLCEPIDSGRTHQIRRHAYALGHPILGDTEHGDTRINRWWRNNRGLNRLALHCFSLDLPSWDDESENGGGGDDDGIDDDDNSGIQCLAPLSPELLQVLQGEGMEQLWEEALERDSRLSAEFVDMRGGSFGRNFQKK
eukprot:CAMPEP_0181050344 /NCGR_PEP_ID=MMETSP1070-20121207/16467_1 /TAXON_ID=265543 /ORGANISM="Minutocellus polymorphus, Strain NH13" /LENGTH=358 /DNA_ID=CAMNT_0023129285 /DNA_START=40 /DNA_END=1116 /DNA_ORIENTATION=+